MLFLKPSDCFWGRIMFKQIKLSPQLGILFDMLPVLFFQVVDIVFKLLDPGDIGFMYLLPGGVGCPAGFDVDSPAPDSYISPASVDTGGYQ